MSQDTPFFQAPMGMAVAIIGILLFIAPIFGLAIQIWRKDDLPPVYFQVVGFGILALILSMIAYWLGTTLGENPEIAGDAITNKYFTGLWFIGAIALFWLRGYKPVLYGSVELFVGATAILYAINSTSQVQSAKLLALSSGIYIVVRGLDNIEKGLPHDFKKKWWELIFWKTPPKFEEDEKHAAHQPLALEWKVADDTPLGDSVEEAFFEATLSELKGPFAADIRRRLRAKFREQQENLRVKAVNGASGALKENGQDE